MAGDDAWVVDITWHVMLIVGNKVAELWSSWGTEALLGLSFAMQVVLSLSAGCRWRGVRGKRRGIIWLCYVGADYMATTALGRLSVSNTSGDRQLVAFWAPFFLMHLGGPDSITAYEQEDNKLAWRSVLGLVVQFLGVLYVLFKSVSGSRVLIPAVLLMLVLGVAKYGERTLALHRANLGNLRSTQERQQRRHRAIGCRCRHRYHHQVAIRIDGGGGGGGEDEDPDQLVMEAHSLLYICKQSIVDCWVKPEDDDGDLRTVDASKLDWGGRMGKVIEMELSLMYDLLYTKASVIHTWHGYCIRALSPVAIAVAFLLVELSNKHVHHKASDVVITRVLVAATFLQETVSLLTALGSSWTGFRLHGSHCRRHEGLSLRLWRQLHRGLAKVKQVKKPDYVRRSWSGKLRQLNMLELVTGAGLALADQDQHFSWDKEEKRYTRTLVMESQVKKLVFEEMGLFLADFVKNQASAQCLYLFDPTALISGFLTPEFPRMIPRADRNVRGQQQQAPEESKDDSTDYAMYMRLGENIILSILMWHIATDVYLTIYHHRHSDSDKQLQEQDRVWVSAVRTVSNYMMYLLVVRPEMLPGRVTRCRRLFQLTCESMAKFWQLSKSSSSSLDRHHRRASPPNHQTKTGQQRELARILDDLDRSSYDPSSTGDTIIERAIDLVKWLLKFDKERPAGETAQFILQEWTIMLFLVSYNCSNESHARRLSRGGELASVVWLMAEHAGLSLVNKIIK